MKLNMRSTRARLSLLYSFIGFFVFIKLWTTGLGIDITTWKYTIFQRHDTHNDSSKAAQNETLGFEKVFYISMPQYSTIFPCENVRVADLAIRSRSDRQDSMAMLATSTNIRLILQDGVFKLTHQLQVHYANKYV